MARIKDSSVREVVAAADMIEVVSGRTALRRSGARYSGRCPFHEERTPSFSVNPVDKLYHCFGCGKGGDVITFVRETENLDFAAAVEWLAERFRVTLEYEETSPRIEEARKRRERLLAVLDQAAAFYERHLWETAAGAPVRAYLESRGLGEAICREFRLGLSPGAGSRRRRAKRLHRGRAARRGLTNARGNDYFPQRLMFPLADARGRIVGFQARKLHEDDPLRGKYVNSPEGELFHKSAILYGLHLARTAIAKQERAVVVEGNTDVIALRQARFEPVVASMGTALTERQLKELQRLTRRIFLCFDSDAAGEEATLRGMELATSLGFDVRVVTLPKGEDPADAPPGSRSGSTGRELRPLSRPARARPRARSAGGFRSGTGDAAAPRTRPSGRRLCACSRPGSTCRRRCSAGSPRRAAPARSPRIWRRRSRAGRPAGADALAACVGTRLVRLLTELSPSTSTPISTAASVRYLVDGGAEDAELVALRAELDARAAREGLDERTGKELLLNLRERRLRRELAHAEFDRVKELQTQLTRVQDAILELT